MKSQFKPPEQLVGEVIEPNQGRWLLGLLLDPVEGILEKRDLFCDAGGLSGQVTTSQVGAGLSQFLQGDPFVNPGKMRGEIGSLFSPYFQLGIGEQLCPLVLMEKMGAFRYDFLSF